MPGFEHSSLEHIQQIRNDLRDRYQEGFPILKELLQNADDAEASCLHLGWFSGFPHIAHPLLKGPALFVVNDGKFKSVDQDGIRRIGISAKASDRAAIGKFGLGLKSVFHVCEAFFYFWSDPDTFKILNPWYGEASLYHKDWEWDETSSIPNDARQAIVGCLESARLLNCPNWFCLWVPFRQEQHRGEVPAIVEEYPRNEKERQESILGLNPAHEISKALPMLRHLKSVSAWNLGTDGSTEMLFQVNLEEGATRCRYRGPEQGISSTTHTDKLLLKGTVNQCLYAGFEQTLIRPIFDRLRRSEYWPTVFGIDSTGTEQPNEEKADPHCAAYFVETPTEGRGSLQIQQAVFLPVGNPKETKPCKGESDFTLMLHGYFFPNAGRTGIEIPEDEIADTAKNETEVRLSWNRELYVRGALPLIIPALNRFVTEGNLAEEKVRNLTETLEKSDTFSQHRASICRDSQWVRRLTASGTAWEELDSLHTEFLEIPPPPNSAPNRPDEVFPNLRELARQHVITFSDAPRLTAQKAASKWSTEMLTQLLPDISVEAVFGSRGMLRYLVDFLKDCEQDARRDVTDVLQRLVTEAFNTVPLEQLRGNRSEIKNYLSLLGSNLCFPIPENLSKEVYRKLFELRPLVLLVPQDLLPDEPHQLLVESLCNEDAVKILRFVSTLGENRELERPERTLVQQVLQASQWDEIRAPSNSLKIFAAYNCRTRTNISISLNQLTELQCNGMLFAYPISQAVHLQQALRSESIFLIENETRTMLGWGDIAPCNERACLQVLESNPALNGPEERINLLDTLLPRVESGPAHNQALRYLIHAHPSDENLPLFMETSGRQQHWPEIARQVLQQRDEKWRVIDNVLRDRISPQHWQPLGIHEFDTDGIAQLIWEVGPEHVDCTIFNINERQQILREMNDIEVLRRLNIYDDIDGNQVQINPECTYWEGDFSCEGIPRGNIVVLRSLPESLRWKQRRILNQFFTAEVAIHVLLETENLDQHWELILNTIDHLNSISSELNQKLKAARWLPIGAGCPPQDVICLQGIEDEVHKIVCECDGSYVDVLMLSPEFRAHRGYRRMRQSIFPPKIDALEMLGEMMARAKKYRIGDIDTQGMDLEVFLATFAPPPPKLMPSHSLLQAVCKAFGEGMCRDHLLPELCLNFSIARIVNILNFLCERHTAAQRNSKSKILDIFNRYLTSATNTSEFREILTQVQLLSREGNWKSPAELCLEAEGIQGNNLLDTEQSSIVRDRVQSSVVVGQQQSGASQPLEGNEEQQFEESAARLEQYFGAWEGAIPIEVIGGFLSLLGNHPKLLRLSRNYLRNREHLGNCEDSYFRGRLDWETLSYSHAQGATENIHETMERQRFLVDVVEGETIQVTNLLGSPFNACIEQQDFNSLTVGPIRYVPRMNYRVNWLRLRSIQPDRFEHHCLLDFIKTTACLLVNEVYRQTVDNLDEVFDDLAKSEQLDIRIAQNLLLDSAFFYVRQLEMHQVNSELSRILRGWDEVRRRKSEAEHNGDSERVREATDELQQKREELKNLIQDDEVVQESLLTAVRAKVSQFQYIPQSVPFELFQNADDAVVESFEMYGDSPLENTDTTRFVIKQEEDKIAFIHWGRPINKFRSAHLDGRARGFDRDLEKMLILSNSDKSDSEGTATGKFGLGFKSVFLVTSKPRVASGRLGFEAVGGFFPRQLTGSSLRKLQDQIEECQNDGKEGTIVSIQAEKCSAQEFLKEFRDVAHFIPVFAKRIRRCEWITNGQTESWEWNDRPLTQSKRVCVGELQPGPDGQWGRQTVMVFRASQGDLLLKLGAQGKVKLVETVPTIWVTVPTKEECDLGFIVNGEFDLDVGRAQLARGSQKNTTVADSIGRDVGNMLIELFDKADRHWDDFCDNLKFVRGADQYQFWHSLWCLFSKVTPERSMNDGDASQLLRRILWKGSEHGMGRLFQQRSAVPSGLWGDHKTLTKRNEIKFKTVGVLDTESVFCQASQWSQFRQQIEPGHVVSDKEIASVMMSLLPDENESVQEIRLQDLVQWDLGSSNCVNPEQASQFGSLITREFLNELNIGNSDQRREYTELTAFLSNVRFQAYDGVFHEAQNLLTKDKGAENRDEPLRAAFAPDNRLLADDYTGSALIFFKACRSRLNAPFESLVEWAAAASDLQKRQAVLQYIVDGELGREVASGIRERINETWLRNLTELPHLTDCFNFWQQSEVFVKLQLSDGRTAPPPISPIPPVAPLVPRDPSSVLEDVHAWWTQAAGDYIRKYDESVYGGLRLQLSDLSDWEDPQTRENWLTLFMLGAFQTMGRVSPHQNRSFLERCRDDGWLQVFASPRTNRQNREAWIEILEHFLDQSGETIQFYHWMRQYVSIVQFANWLQDYRDAFLAIDQLNCQFTLTAITRPRYSSHFQGSDLYAPSIDRALGIGACFVVRELMRLGVLSSVYAHEHCYTPVSRVRRLLESIGCPDLDSNVHQRWERSRTIYEFLREHLAERATFNKAYDIPFLIIADCEALQNQFFRTRVLQDVDDEETYE